MGPSQIEERDKNYVSSVSKFSSTNTISSKNTQRNDSEKEFKIDRVYKLTRILGHGAYGVVGAFRNEKTGEKVAIKKIQKIFTNMLLARRTLRELKLLRHLGAHENIIGIRGILLPTNPYFEEIYVVQDLMEADLHQIIQSGQELTDAHYQYFTYQILKAVKYIHSCNIIHRDLKPGNLLVNSNCELKICDFGLARGMSQQKRDPSHGFMSEYVATRWYRAPEVMLSHACYNQSMDVWSIGCIFAELIGGKVLFPGKQLLDQMNLILNILGTPSEETISRIPSKRSQAYLKSQTVRSKLPFSTLFPKANPLAIDLLSKMLVFDPMHRISVDDALKHPYLANHYRSKDIVVSRLFADNDFEHAETLEEIREHIWKEIKVYHPSFLPPLTRSSLSFPLASNALPGRSGSTQAIYSRLNASKDSPIATNTRDEDYAKHSNTEDPIDMSHLKVF